MLRLAAGYMLEVCKEVSASKYVVVCMHDDAMLCYLCYYSLLL